MGYLTPEQIIQLAEFLRGTDGMPHAVVYRLFQAEKGFGDHDLKHLETWAHLFQCHKCRLWKDIVNKKSHGSNLCFTCG